MATMATKGNQDKIYYVIELDHPPQDTAQWPDKWWLTTDRHYSRHDLSIILSFISDLCLIRAVLSAIICHTKDQAATTAVSSVTAPLPVLTRHWVKYFYAFKYFNVGKWNNQFPVQNSSKPTKAIRRFKIFTRQSSQTNIMTEIWRWDDLFNLKLGVRNWTHMAQGTPFGLDKRS